MCRTRCALSVLAVLVLAAAPVSRSRAADCPRGTIITVAGTGVFPYFGEGGPATEANIKPSAVALGAKGIYVADAASHRVFLIDAQGIIRTIAGNGNPAFARDGGPAAEASLNEPRGLAIGPDGSVYIADSRNHRIRKVDPNGTITKIAGNGADAYAGDGGPAVRASLNRPDGLAVGGDGSVYIADTLNSRIRKVDPRGIITTVAGTGEFAAGTPPRKDLFAAHERVGDGGPAKKARLYGPTDVAIGVDGSLYVADMVNGRVRKVDTRGIITTVAGKGLAAMFEESEERLRRDEPLPTGDGGPATEANVGMPGAIDVRPDGSLFIGSMSGVRKVDPAGIINTVAGASDRYGFSGDGGPAIQAALSSVRDVAVGADGSLYIVDEGNYRLRKVDSDGIITTIAGTGEGEWHGDGGPALEASLNSPSGVAVAADGSLYVADTQNNRIREITPDGIITTVAGRGPSGIPPPEDWAPAGPGPATESAVLHPQDVELGADGSMYIAEWGAVRKVDRDGIISTVAGDPSAEPFTKDIGDGGPALSAPLSLASDVALDSVGRLYIADTGHHRVRRVDLDGAIVTVAGNGDREHSGDGGPATEAGIPGPAALAFGADGSLYIADRSSHAVRKVDPGGIITTIAGSGIVGYEGWGYSGDGGPAARARLQSPAGLAFGPDGCLYIADSGNNRIRKIDRNGIIITVVGSGPGGNEGGGFAGDGGPAAKARLKWPKHVAFDRNGNLYIADAGNDRIRKVCGLPRAADYPPGTIVTVAGNGRDYWTGDGGPAVEATLSLPTDVAVAGDGGLYVADSGNDRVRKVSPDGMITTVAGTGKAGPIILPILPPGERPQPLHLGDGGPAIRAAVPFASSVAVGPEGSLFVGAFGRVRRIDRAGIIQTVAGGGTVAWSREAVGDGGSAVEAWLSMPAGLAFGADGSMFIAGSISNRVRRVDPAGIITTFAGSDEVRPGVSGDGGPAVKAYLWDPMDMAIGPDGAIYIAESGNHRIRKVDRRGIITTVAGSGPGGKKSAGYSGDGGPATKARLRHCKGVAVAADGTIYIADTGNHCVRKVDRRGIITTVAGSGAGADANAGFSGDGGPATKARLCWPQGLALGHDGSLYIADMGNGRIRKVCGVAAIR